MKKLGKLMVILAAATVLTGCAQASSVRVGVGAAGVIADAASGLSACMVQKSSREK